MSSDLITYSLKPGGMRCESGERGLIRLHWIHLRTLTRLHAKSF